MVVDHPLDRQASRSGLELKEDDGWQMANDKW
jgi:hypothetical protein